MEAQITNREDLQQWLRNRPHQDAAAIAALAARAALRSLPAVAFALDLAGPQRFADITLATARAVALARVAAVYPTRFYQIRAANVDYVAGAAADAAAANALVLRAYAANTAAAAAAFAIRAAAHVTKAEFSANANSNVIGAGDAAQTAADAASNAAAGNLDAAGKREAAAYAAAAAARDAMWSQVRADLRELERGGGAAALMSLSLWSAPPLEWVAENWAKLKSRLLELNHWGFWIDWYEAILAGRPLWPEIDPKAREDLEVKICLIDDELWAQGPAIVNAEIDRLIAEAMAGPKTLQPLDGVPSVFTYGWTVAGRIGVVAGPQNQPYLPQPSSADDHRACLDAARKHAERLADDLRARKFNVRSDYLDALNHYLADLPAAPEVANLVLADGEMRILRALHNDEAGILPAPFAARLRIVQEQHLALRPFHPEIERLYDAIARGKLAAPLPLDAVEALERTVTAHTPSVFEPDVSAGQEQLKRVPPVVALPPEDALPVEGVILPPPDPVGVPSPARTREFERASALNQIGGVIKSGAELGKGLAGWDVVTHDFWQHAPAVIDWLKAFF